MSLPNQSLMIINHCVPCACACRHCFFHSRKTAGGVPYDMGEAIALRFAQHGIPVSYAISHCADYPQLTRNIELNKRLGFAGHAFLQINGIGLRDESKLRTYLSGVQRAGVTTIDATFYGLAAHHDNFAGRSGDFQFLLEIVRAGLALGLTLQPTFVALEDNKAQLGELVALLTSLGCTNIHGFLHDYRGRGEALEDVRLTWDAYHALPKHVRDCISIRNHKTEAAWLASDFTPPTQRHLVLALRPDNIEMINAMHCDEIVDYLVGLDEAYHAAMPDMHTLAKLYGDADNQKLYRQRDLQWKWQKTYHKEHGLAMHDVTDERNCGAMRR